MGTRRGETGPVNDSLKKLGHEGKKKSVVL